MSMSTAERTRGPGVAEAEAVAARVTDPEMPMLTLLDLGVLREVVVEEHPVSGRRSDLGLGPL